MTHRLPYIPRDYVEQRTARLHVWHHPKHSRPEPWESLVDDVVTRVESCLDFKLTCQLHIVIYATNQDARFHLERPVPGNMLLAPLQGPNDSLIAVQSDQVDAANGVVARMQRLLAHELTHVAMALRSGSSKQLGDNDMNMRVAAWVNEGLAVSVAAITSNQQETIQNALRNAQLPWSAPVDVDTALNDLSSEYRAAAFDVAIARVWRALEARGVPFVFERLTEPHAWDKDCMGTATVSQ